MHNAPQATALAAALLLGACASTPPEPPPELLQARAAVRAAEIDPDVLSSAPLELKNATDTLNRANRLLAKRESLAEVASAAYVADRQAHTAMEIARAKRAEDAIRGAEVDREKARGDIKAAEARRAREQAMAARDQASIAGARAADAEMRASSAEAQATDAQQRAAMLAQHSAELQAQLNQIQAQATERGMLVTLGDVLFEFNRAEVKPTAQAELRKLADFLRLHPDRRVLVEGHTDNIGSTDYNVDLSRRRAAAVRAALMALGVAGDRIDSTGYGKDYPVADNGSDTNRALNRRVEVYISNNDQPVQRRG